MRFPAIAAFLLAAGSWARRTIRFRPILLLYRCRLSQEKACRFITASSSRVHRGGSLLRRKRHSMRALRPSAHTAAGPTWRWKDGSAIIGHLLITQPAPEHTSIPWLLLTASPSIDSAPTGMLARVTYVRRSDTHGGVPPAGCDVHHMAPSHACHMRLSIPFTRRHSRPGRVTKTNRRRRS